jgi:two-component system cell cycle response regulator
MNATILIVGEPEFSERLLKGVRGLSTLPHSEVTTNEEAIKYLETQTPDVILLQAAHQSNWELCYILKQQRRLLWCYWILIDERIHPGVTSWEDGLMRQNGFAVTAIETGADAYLWVPVGESLTNQDEHEYLSRLIQAHIRSATRRIQAYQDLSQKNDLLSAIALVDQLTQLGNRRAFDWELPRQVETARSQEHPFSLLVLDIDFFKRVNDEYGHLVGDQVLRMFADRLRHQMRFHETPFRYGGEEFVVILQNTSNEEAEKVAERMRRLVNESPFVISNDLDLPLSVSIGAATLSDLDDSKGLELIARADQNLLEAKKSGRNRVIIS